MKKLQPYISYQTYPLGGIGSIAYFVSAFVLSVFLTSCSQEDPGFNEDFGDCFQMSFQVRALGAPESSRTEPVGFYGERTYPGENLYLTAFLVDAANVRQYYFRDQKLIHDQTTGNWYLPGWYWPIQGKMAFLSYWCEKFSKEPIIDEIKDVEGNLMTRMNVDATDLDGKNDFLYLSQIKDCPQPGGATLSFSHGLAWISVTLSALVLKENGEKDDDKTLALQEHLKVNKVVIEDCALRGLCTIIPDQTPGKGVTWKTYDDRDPNNIVYYTRDLVYTNNLSDDESPLTHNQWEEIEDASEVQSTEEPFSLGEDRAQLGEYNIGTSSNPLNGYGLLIIPQNKTAITVDYTITDIMGRNIQKVELYELRDNTLTWEAGYHYNYDIIFRNYDDYALNFDLISSWEGINPQGFYETSWGGIYSENNSGSGTQFIYTEPVYDGGSVTSDDMDYSEGPRVF